MPMSFAIVCPSLNLSYCQFEKTKMKPVVVGDSSEGRIDYCNVFILTLLARSYFKWYNCYFSNVTVETEEGEFRIIGISEKETEIYVY